MTVAASHYVMGYTGRAKHDAHVRYFDHPTWANVYVEVYRAKDSHRSRITHYYADPSWGERVACDTEAQALAIAARMLASWQDATATLPGRDVPPRKVLHGDGF